MEDPKVLERMRADWNQRTAARQLALPLRTLVYKIRRLGIRRPTVDSKR